MRSFPSPRIVRSLEKKGQLSPRHRSPNYAVISLSRPLSPLDRKSSRQKSGVCFSGFAWHELSPRTPVKVTPRPNQIISFKSHGIAQNQRHAAGHVDWKRGMFQATRGAQVPFSLPCFYHSSVRRSGQHYSYIFHSISCD